MGTLKCSYIHFFIASLILFVAFCFSVSDLLSVTFWKTWEVSGQESKWIFCCVLYFFYAFLQILSQSYEGQMRVFLESMVIWIKLNWHLLGILVHMYIHMYVNIHIKIKYDNDMFIYSNPSIYVVVGYKKKGDINRNDLNQYSYCSHYKVVCF